ncbi:1120_t:CDS:10 [Diversispora eburnea]|uniref:Conserved oligomeric Golgi complex subunit 5 n=1 Tax=Diversispora eburnea TaxID=1213867 RepID=A0A9N9BFU5_9GLOM|nr:1120_t:CDS:10 [Diversispora eburnea]
MTSDLPEPDLYIGKHYKSFLSNNFDPKEYANSTINSTSESDGDITISLAKLSFGIDNLNKQLHDQVIAHFEDLISQASGIRDLEIVLKSVKEGVNSLTSSLERLKTKIHAPYTQIKNYTLQLERYQTASDLLRNIVRFFHLARLLEGQLSEINNEDEKAIEYVKAAPILGELEILLKEVDFEGIELVQAQIPEIQKSKDKITVETFQLLQKGIDCQNEADIILCIQIFKELHEIGESILKYVDDIYEKLLEQIKDVVDVNLLQKEVKDSGVIPMKGIRRLGTEPSTGASSVWTSTLWKRMEILMNEICESYPMTGLSYLEDDSILDTEFLQHYWKLLSQNFGRELKEATKGNTFMQQTLINGYPKLIRLFRDFFTKLEEHGHLKLDGEFQSQETLIMLHSILSFETGYLERSIIRLFDPINVAFPAGIHRTPPSKSDVTNIVRAISTELAAVRIDPHLLRSVAKNVVKALNLFGAKAENMAIVDSSAYQVTGPGPCTASQNTNFELINSLYALHQSAWKVLEEYPDNITEIVFDAVENTRKVMQNIVDPLFHHIRKEFESTILKIHREDFSRQLSINFMLTEAQCSTYMIELSNRMNYVQKELFSKISCGLNSKEWTKELGKRILYFWLLHASLVRPLTENGKKKLTRDMGQLEFSLNQLLIENGSSIEELGDEYNALRAFKQLLFLDKSHIAEDQYISNLPLLILIHHIIVSSSTSTQNINTVNTLQLPYKIYGWTEADYSKWLDEHNESEGIDLVKGCLRTNSELKSSNEEELFEEKLVRKLLKERAGIEV